jgi:hypothetical protein
MSWLALASCRELLRAASSALDGCSLAGQLGLFAAAGLVASSWRRPRRRVAGLGPAPRQREPPSKRGVDSWPRWAGAFRVKTSPDSTPATKEGPSQTAAHSAGPSNMREAATIVAGRRSFEVDASAQPTAPLGKAPRQPACPSARRSSFGSTAKMTSISMATAHQFRAGHLAAAIPLQPPRQAQLNLKAINLNWKRRRSCRSVAAPETG